MGYTIYYHLVREEPLGDADRDALVAHVRRSNANVEWLGEGYDLQIACGPRPDGLLAYGFTKPQDVDDEDCASLLEILTTLRGLLRGAELFVDDDLQVLGWEAKTKTFVFDPSLHTDRRSFDYAGQWIRAMKDESQELSLVELLGAKLANALERLAAGDAVFAAKSTPSKLILALAKLESEDPRCDAIRAGLDTCDATAVAKLCITKALAIRSTPASSYAMNHLARTLDVTPLAGNFWTAWSKAPRSKYYYADLLHLMPNEFLAKLSAEPAIIDGLCRDFVESIEEQRRDPDERVCRRLETASELLGSSASPKAFRLLRSIAKEDRGRTSRTSDWMYRSYIQNAVLGALAALAWEGSGPTVALELAHMNRPWSPYTELLVVGAQLCGAAFLPLIKVGLDGGYLTEAVIEALAQLSGPEATRALQEIASHYPYAKSRLAARNALQERDESAPPEVAEPPPHELLVHGDPRVRTAAFDLVVARDDEADTVALCLAERLDWALNLRADAVQSVLGGDGWRKRFPKKVAAMRPVGRLTWALEASVGNPRIPPLLRRVLDDGPDAVAESYPNPLIRLSASELEHWSKLEEQSLS